jgi:hypothetical protein
MVMQSQRTWLAGWKLVVLGSIALGTLAGEAEAASTLNWAQTVTVVFTEIRNVGFACFFGALCIAGIEIIFHRHLDRMGQVIGAIGVGGGLIGGASAAAAGILGSAAAATLATNIHIVTLTEAMGDITGVLLYYAITVGGAGTLWVLGGRHGRGQ